MHDLLLAFTLSLTPLLCPVALSFVLVLLCTRLSRLAPLRATRSLAIALFACLLAALVALTLQALRPIVAPAKLSAVLLDGAFLALSAFVLREFVRWFVGCRVALAGRFAVIYVVLQTTTSLLVGTFVLQLLPVNSSRMYPQLRAGDRILALRLGYDGSQPYPLSAFANRLQRGTVVAYQQVTSDHKAHQPRILLSRCVGLPADVVEDLGSTVRVNGTTVPTSDFPDDSLTPTGQSTATTTATRCVVPPGKYFLLGDNLQTAVDSRTFGPVAAHQIRSRAVAVIFPPDRADIISTSSP